MGMQQTYGGVARIIAPLFFGWAFDSIGVSAPYFFSSAFLLATLSLGFGLDQYARPGLSVARQATGEGHPQISQITQNTRRKAEGTE